MDKSVLDMRFNASSSAASGAASASLGEPREFSSRQRTMLTGKIHRATCTGAKLDYVGSITIDAELMKAADILPGEQVDIVNVTNGSRITTYAIPGTPGEGEAVLNGAAAHLFSRGDVLIIMCYGRMSDAEARIFEPSVVFVDSGNRIIDVANEPGMVPQGYGLHSSGEPIHS